MAKRVFIALICLTLCLAAAPAARAEGLTEIRDVEGLLSMAQNPSGRYRLAADIDMSQVNWTPIAFSGELDGGGHCLYNLRVTSAGPDRKNTYDGNKKEYDTGFLGLFSVLEKASVHDLKITGAYVTVDNDSHCFAAILAGYMNRSDIRAVSVSGRVRMNNSAVMAGVAGLVGYGCGTFDRCDARVELIFEDRNFASRCEEFMGGVLACGIASINGCVVDIDGYDSCHGYVHNGGLVGMYYHCLTNYDCGPVNNNIITGRITFFEDNPDRRAYCEATIGEPLSKPTKTKGNHADFKSQEVKTFDVVLEPEKCAEPQYTDAVTPPAGSHWGFTRHTCAVCGYHYTDSYTPPTP